MPDATTSSTISARWLQDDAIALQLKEMGQVGTTILDYVPNRDVAKALIASLCVIRRSPSMKATLEQALAHLQRQSEWRTFISWMLMTKTQVMTDGTEFPFSMSDDEFEYYSGELFKGRMQIAKSFYKPPSFYGMLASNIATTLVGAGVASVAIAIIPEATGAAALGVAGFGVAGSRAVFQTVGGLISNAVLPSVSVNEYLVGRMWPAYLAEYQRRQLS